MSRNMRKSLIAVGLVAVGSLIAMPAVAQKQATPQAIPVNVENTPNVNVANTPSVSVTNTPSVNVANTPAVTLSSGASVNITSPLDGQGNPTPIAVLDAFQPYEDTCQIQFIGAQFGTCDFQPLPGDKHLVVQEFGALGFMETGLQPQYAALSRQGSLVLHYFPTIQTSSYAGLDSFATNGATRIYVPAGNTPTCVVDLTNSSTIGVYACDLSGYLVDTPQAGSPGAAPGEHHQLQPPLVRNPGRGR